MLRWGKEGEAQETPKSPAFPMLREGEFFQELEVGKGREGGVTGQERGLGEGLWWCGLRGPLLCSQTSLATSQPLSCLLQTPYPSPQHMGKDGIQLCVWGGGGYWTTLKGRQGCGAPRSLCSPWRRAP